MDCPAIKDSKGDQIWQYKVQWIGPAIIDSKSDQM